MTDTERTALNARLAMAIFPGAEIVSCADGSVDVYVGPQPSGTGWRSLDFCADAKASRELVEWLAKQPVLTRVRFEYEVDALLSPHIGLFTALDYMTTPLLLIARAADAAIGGKDER